MGPLKVFADAPDSAPAARAVAVHATHLSLNGADATVIGREWAIKTHPTCGGLCQGGACSFSGGFCLVPVYRHVPIEECRDFAVSASDV